MKRLMGENGPAEPQVGYIDGYLLEERLLEGVLFRVEPSPDGSKLVCTGTPNFDHFMAKFSDEMKAKWYERAADHAMQDECQDLECTEDLYWEEAE